MRTVLLVFLLSMTTAANASEEGRNLLKQTGYLGALSLTAMSALWLMPAENSQWYDKPSLTPAGLGESWRRNVTSGPVWDGDMRIFNGYGHIHSGAAYTLLCLGNGLSELSCTVYANLVSLAWEYGPEALVEIPSYQDILMTGMIGSRVGLQFFRWKKSIAASHGRLLGSKILGSVTTTLMDPLSSFINLMPGVSSSPSSAMSIPLVAPRTSKDGSTSWTVGYSVNIVLGTPTRVPMRGHEWVSPKPKHLIRNSVQH